MESMENINNESKEKLCFGCRQPLVNNRCQNVLCKFFNVEIEKEEEKIEKGEEPAKSTIDFIKELEARSKAYVFEEEKKDLHDKEPLIGEKEKAIVQKKEEKEPLPKNIQMAIGYTQDFLQREIDFGTRYTKSAVVDDWSERQISNWLERSLCQAFENTTEKTTITESEYLIEIARELKINAPERIKNIFYNSVLPEYIRKLRE